MHVPVVRCLLVIMFAIGCIASVFTRPVAAAGKLIQTTNASNSGVTSISATYASAVAANNLLVVICGANSATASIAGPSGFTTAREDDATATLPGQGIFYKVATGTESTITCTSNASVTLGIQIYEYSGIAASRPLDATNTTISSSTVATSASSGNVTTSYANDLLIAGITANGGTSISGWTNSFVQENNFAVTAGKVTLRTTWGGADYFVGVAGTYSTSAALGVSTASIGQIAAFRVNTPAVSTLSADMVDGSGASIASPNVVMGSTTTSFNCATVTGSLASSSQKIRVTNSTSNPAWSVSIGATNGASSLWTAGSYGYDYNDSGGAGCVDSDGDGHAGLLSVVPSGINAVQQAGCTTTGLSLLSSATGFTSANAVTVAAAAAGSTTDTGCYWDISGINVSQTVPAAQHAGTYSLNLTITVVAN